MQHSAFYAFSPLPEPAAVREALRAVAAPRLTGSLVLAPEGISGAVAGAAEDVTDFERVLCSLPGLAGMAFKRSGCRTPPYARLAITVKPELVACGLPMDGDVAGSMLSPAAWRELLAQPDVVLLDNRNRFEWRLGRFRGAPDPGVANFRDFAARVLSEVPRWKAEGKRIAMYCTGGIRCEKTAPWMRSLGLSVFQLEGGILNWLQSMPDATREWQGECFVFDNRIALGADLQERATTAAQVYDPAAPDESWRLERALRLQASADVTA